MVCGFVFQLTCQFQPSLTWPQQYRFDSRCLVAIKCNILDFMAMHYNTMHHKTMQCNECNTECTAMHYIAWQSIAPLYNIARYWTTFHNSVQYWAIFFNIGQYSTLLDNIVQYWTIFHNNVQYWAIFYNIGQNSTILNNIVQSCTCTVQQGLEHRAR